MKFSIREILLVTLVVAVLLGWLVDHWRAAAREAAWERVFSQSLNALSELVQEDMGFDTPDGPWRVIPKEKIPLDETAPR